MFGKNKKNEGVEGVEAVETVSEDVPHTVEQRLAELELRVDRLIRKNCLLESAEG